MNIDPLTINDQSIQAHIGQTLRQLRERHQLRLESAAQQAGISTPELEAIESGSVALEANSLYRLCLLYESKPNELYAGLPGMSLGRPIKEDDMSHLVQNFLQVDQPNRGQLFRDFVSNISDGKVD